MQTGATFLFFNPQKHMVHSGRRGLQAQRNLERDAFVSRTHVSISNVRRSPLLPEVTLLGKVQAGPVPPVPKVCDEEKLLEVKCSWDPSYLALRMPHGCSQLHRGIAPACPNLQGASRPSPGSLGTSQPAEGICRVQTANNSVWACPQGPQWTPHVQHGGMVQGQRLDPFGQAEALCNSAGEVKNNFSNFCLGTDRLRLSKILPRFFCSDLVRFQGTRKAEMKITNKEL